MLGKQVSNLFLLKKESSGNHWDNVCMYACKYVFYIAACLTYVTLGGLQWNAERENVEQPSIIQPINYTARSQGQNQLFKAWWKVSKDGTNLISGGTIFQRAGAKAGKAVS